MRTVTFLNCCCLLICIHLMSDSCCAIEVSSVEQLVAAVEQGQEGESIVVAPGVYRLSAPLELKTGMTLQGAGIEKTVITQTDSWQPSTKTLPDPETKTKGLDMDAYLIRIQAKANKVTVSDLTLTGPKLHGAIFGIGNENLHLHHLRIEDFLWSGIRTFSMRQAQIHDCQFVDAGDAGSGEVSLE